MNLDNAGMRYTVVALAFVLRKAKAFVADNHPWANNYPTSNSASITNIN